LVIENLLLAIADSLSSITNYKSSIFNSQSSSNAVLESASEKDFPVSSKKAHPPVSNGVNMVSAQDQKDAGLAA
jgi:hypothetical protein